MTDRVDMETGEIIVLGFDTTQLQDFGDFVNAGLAELGKRDRSTWALGDIAAALEIREGRPNTNVTDNENTVATIADLAREWGSKQSTVNDWRNNSLFWQGNSRVLVSSWWEAALIRRYVEWEQAGQDYETKFERALEVLEEVRALLLRGTALEMWLKDKRRANLLTVPVPTGTYNVIYADPPWEYNNTGLNGAAENHYQTMPIEAIYDLPQTIKLGIADHAVLFLWVTNPMLIEGLECIEQWGFEYKTQLVWVKTELAKPGVGWYVRGRHELLLIATRGSFTPLDARISPPIGSVLEAPIREHSRKPDEVYTIIERLYPGCNYVELFARGAGRPDWAVWGDQAGG